jgi:hypothetical protein
MRKSVLIDDGQEPQKFILEEEWRALVDHPKYEMNRQGVIRHAVSKKIRNEPNLGFRYYESGVRKSISIRTLLGKTFPDGDLNEQ